MFIQLNEFLQTCILNHLEKHKITVLYYRLFHFILALSNTKYEKFKNKKY